MRSLRMAALSLRSALRASASLAIAVSYHTAFDAYAAIETQKSAKTSWYIGRIAPAQLKRNPSKTGAFCFCIGGLLHRFSHELWQNSNRWQRPMGMVAILAVFMR